MTDSKNDKLTALQWAKFGAILVAVFLTPVGIGMGWQRIEVMRTCQPGSPEYENSQGVCKGAGRREDNANKYGAACSEMIRKSLIDPGSFQPIEVDGDGKGYGVSVKYSARSSGGFARVAYGACSTKTGNVADLQKDYNIDISDIYGH